MGTADQGADPQAIASAAPLPIDPPLPNPTLPAYVTHDLARIEPGVPGPDSQPLPVPQPQDARCLHALLTMHGGGINPCRADKLPDPADLMPVVLTVVAGLLLVRGGVMLLRARSRLAATGLIIAGVGTAALMLVLTR